MSFDYDAKREQLRNEVDPDTGIDFGARYTTERMPHVALYLLGYDLKLEGPEDGLILSCNVDVTDIDHEHDEDCYFPAEADDYEWVEDKSTVRMCMVGDDHIDTIDPSELVKVDSDDVCSCGAIGCWSANGTHADFPQTALEQLADM
jgi:hypothetical protein